MVSSSRLDNIKNFFIELGLAAVLLIAVAIADIGFYLWKLRRALSRL